MLSALDASGNVVNLLDEVPERQEFSCPACASPVRLKAGKVMRPHFAHVSLQDCHFYSENESAEHLSLKAELYASLSRSEKVAIEQVLPDLGQIADLMVNDKLALEVQCSRLSEERLRERTQSYHEHGFSVLWLLGEKLWLGKSLSPLQKQFLYFSQNMGFHVWELDVKQRLIRLKYLIYEDMFGKVHYLSQTCSFDEDVMAFLRLPFQRQRLSSYTVAMSRHPQAYIQQQLLAGNRRWLRQQEEAYLAGHNLIAQPTSAFFPQVKPPQSEHGFCQIQQDLSACRAAFCHYYKNQEDKEIQRLYPPAFYVKMVARNGGHDDRQTDYR